MLLHPPPPQHDVAPILDLLNLSADTGSLVSYILLFCIRMTVAKSYLESDYIFPMLVKRSPFIGATVRHTGRGSPKWWHLQCCPWLSSHFSLPSHSYWSHLLSPLTNICLWTQTLAGVPGLSLLECLLKLFIHPSHPYLTPKSVYLRDSPISVLFKTQPKVLITGANNTGAVFNTPFSLVVPNTHATYPIRCLWPCMLTFLLISLRGTVSTAQTLVQIFLFLCFNSIALQPVFSIPYVCLHSCPLYTLLPN